MQCPYCSGDSLVLDSRQSTDGVRRRRRCAECKRRFTTYEKIANPNIKVLKRRGGTEAFRSEKLVLNLQRVCRGRPNLQSQDFDRLARAIEADLVDKGLKSIKSSQIAQRLLDALSNLDKRSYERLAANYLDETGKLRLEQHDTPADSDQLGLFEDDAEE